MNDGRRRDTIMGFIFWGFIVLFFFLVYPQIFLSLVRPLQIIKVHWLVKPGFVISLAVALSILGFSVTTLLVSGLLFFGVPILYRAWCKYSLKRFIISLRSTCRTKRKTAAKLWSRNPEATEKSVKVLFSTSQKKGELETYQSDDSVYTIVESKVLPLKTSLDKGQQTSQECIVSNDSEKKGKSAEERAEGVTTKDVRVQEEVKTVEVGVQAMRPDTLDPRIEARISHLESRLRLEEMRNRAWCARMAETEECLSVMRIQMRKMKSTPRVVDEGTNTSVVNLAKHETKHQTPRTVEGRVVRDQGDTEPELVKEPSVKVLHPTETNMYLKQSKVQQVVSSEQSVNISELRMRSSDVYAAKLCPSEPARYPDGIELVESTPELDLTREGASEKALIKVAHEHLALKKVDPERMALKKVDPEGLALTKVDPASRQVKPWKAQTFPTPLPDDAIYSEDFNTLLRRLRAEIGESTWARMRIERSQNNARSS